MRSERRKKMIILIILLIGVCSISIGFAAYSTSLKIESGLAISPDESAFSVKFSSSATSLATDPVSPSSKSEALETTDATITNSTKPTISGYSATFTKNGQYVTYSFYVRNTGHYTAYLNSISFNGEITCAAKLGTSESSANENCDKVTTRTTVKVGNITTTESMSDITGETLSPNESKLVEVTFEYISGGNFIDGDFSMEFPSISLYYASTGGINGAPGTQSDKVLLTSNERNLVLSDLSNKQLENYRIYGSSDGVGDATDSGYVIPITIRGKNIFNFFDINSQTFPKTTASTKKSYVFPNLIVGKKYTLSFSFVDDSKILSYIYFYGFDETNTRQEFAYITTNKVINNPYTFTVKEGVEYFFNRGGNYTISSTDIARLATFQLEEGDTATTYEPYVATNINIEISSPLMEGDCIDFKSQTVVRRDGTKENISIPAITTLSVPTTVIEVTTENQPSMIEVSYLK